MACARGHFDVVMQLLAYGAATTARDEKGALPAHAAAFHSHLDVLRLLLPTGSVLQGSEAFIRAINGNIPILLLSVFFMNFF